MFKLILCKNSQNIFLYKGAIIDNILSFRYNKYIGEKTMGAIWNFFKGIFKFIWKVIWWVIKGFLSPIGLLFRLLIIGAIVVGIILIF